MNSLWKSVRLEDVCEIIMGQSPPSDVYNTTKDGLPFFQGKAEFTDLYPVVQKWCSKPNKIAEPNDILLSVRAPVGPTNLANIKCCIGRGLAAIRYKLPECYKYLFYFLRSIDKVLAEQGTGSTFSAISGSVIRNQTFPLPPLPEQHRIVAKIEELFSDLDAGIASLRKAKAQLKIYRQSVLKWAFEGKLTEEWRKKRLNGDSGDSHDEDGFKNHGNHKNHKNYRADNLPAGWEWVNVSEILTDSPTNGRSVPTRKGGFRVLRLTALGDKFIDITQFKEGDWTEAEAKPYLLRRNDFLVCRGNGSLHLVGRGCLVLSDCMMAYPDTLIRLRCSPEVIDTSFLYAVWISRIVRDQIETTARTTAGIFKINQKDIGRIRLPIPPLAEQIEIVSKIESRLSLSDNLEKTIATSLTQAAALRQSILKRAFEGKLVPQDPKDLPAAELLKRIMHEKVTKEIPQKGRLRDYKNG